LTDASEHADRLKDERDRSPLPFLTADLAGIGGTLKQAPEDFVVEEIPAYEPVGDGEHLFLWIEKRDVSAEMLTRHISQTLGISAGDIGAAGLKDRRAVTRQYVSVPARCADHVSHLDTESIRVVRSARHQNKLRTGHSKGNRFSILVRDVAGDALERAELIAAHIQPFGFPNYFGAQRFGIGGETLNTGLDLLQGRMSEKKIPRARRKFLLRLSLSAAQSFLFNQALSARLNDKLFDRVLLGDVMQVVDSGGPFVVEDVGIEQGRLDMGEIAVSGPIFGPKMTSPRNEPARREQQLLDRCELSDDAFKKFGKLTRGTRRAYSASPGELSISSEQDGLRFRFTLPRGVYATTLLREFQKDESL